LQKLRGAGVNRLSVGVQSFDDAIHSSRSLVSIRSPITR
jgi:coproporphyrinogen III oxidase-like Fe-S oxidoreductase